MLKNQTHTGLTIKKPVNSKIIDIKYPIFLLKRMKILELGTL